MGFLIYDDCRPIAVEDRMLAHLQIVIIDKLRRGEAFALNLRSDRQMVMTWVSKSTPLQFIYEGNGRPSINRTWVELLATEAGFRGSLDLLPEPAEVARVATPDLKKPAAEQPVSTAEQPVSTGDG
jgi:hypothetical protein